jgi:GDP-mannose transporter
MVDKQERSYLPTKYGEYVCLQDSTPNAHQPHRIMGIPSVLLAGMCYCVASGGMVLFNKHALNPRSFGFTAPTALLCFQCALSVLLVKILGLVGVVKLQPLQLRLVAVWFPVNLIFVGMVGSSFYALQHVGVTMVTVWKNVSNVATAVLEVIIFKKSHSSQVWATLCLMLISAIVGAWTDTSFTWSGYSWLIANCCFTSAYALYLRAVMEKVSQHTYDKQKLDEFSMVYYNNLLSIPPSLVLMLVFGEHRGLLQQTALQDPRFQAVAVAGGLIGFGISFAGLWLLSQTTATVYSLVGALNKIPLAIVGILVLKEPTNPHNMASIAIGLFAGILFSCSNSNSNKK